MTKQNNPIFVHSLFRAGSTYIFKLFRESAAGYAAYEEPLHEIINFAATNPEALLSHHLESSKTLRHSTMDKPYFHELYLVADKIGPLFQKEFSYDQFFLTEDDDISDFKTYLSTLIDSSDKRAFIQCCNTTGRVKQCRAISGGVHLFLWRNPWDQWWSYKVSRGFDPYNLLILNAKKLPAFMQPIKAELDIPPLHSPDTYTEYAHYQSHKITSEQSYLLFYALWCHAMLEALPECDLPINIDFLSTSAEYKTTISKALEQWDIRGVDFSGCDIPRGIYSETEISFFAGIEQKVHKLLMKNGYTQSMVDQMLQIRQEFYVPITDSAELLQTMQRDITRARELVYRYETILSESSRQAWAEKNAYDEKITHLETQWAETRAELAEIRDAMGLTFFQFEKAYLLADLEQMQSNLENTQNQLKIEETKNRKLAAQLSTSQHERRKLAAQFNAATNEKKKLQEKLNTLRAEREFLRAQVTQKNKKAEPSPVMGFINSLKSAGRKFSNWLKNTPAGHFLYANLRKIFPDASKAIAKKLETAPPQPITPLTRPKPNGEAKPPQPASTPEIPSSADVEYFASLFEQGIKLKNKAGLK